MILTPNQEFARLLGIFEEMVFFEENWERSPKQWHASEFPFELNLSSIKRLFQEKTFRKEDIRLVLDGDEIKNFSGYTNQRGYLKSGMVWNEIEREGLL